MDTEEQQSRLMLNELNWLWGAAFIFGGGAVSAVGPMLNSNFFKLFSLYYPRVGLAILGFIFFFIFLSKFVQKYNKYKSYLKKGAKND